jgi:hypothetical protein
VEAGGFVASFADTEAGAGATDRVGVCMQLGRIVRRYTQMAASVAWVLTVDWLAGMHGFTG